MLLVEIVELRDGGGAAVDVRGEGGEGIGKVVVRRLKVREGLRGVKSGE